MNKVTKRSGKFLGKIVDRSHDIFENSVQSTNLE